MRETERVKPSTIRRRLAALSSLYKHLVHHGHAARNPVAEVERPEINRDEGSTLAFSKGQARKILDAPKISSRIAQPAFTPSYQRRRDRRELSRFQPSAARSERIRKSSGERSTRIPRNSSHCTAALRSSTDHSSHSMPDPAILAIKFTFSGLERSLSLERLSTYPAAVNGDHAAALRLYVWNTRISAAFYSQERRSFRNDRR